jgi:hypothetical protein
MSININLIIIALVVILIVLLCIVFSQKQEWFQDDSSWLNNDQKINNTFAEETTGPRKEYVLTTLDQCVSLCTTDGNRPGILQFYKRNPNNDIHDTEQCVEDCKKFIQSK